MIVRRVTLFIAVLIVSCAGAFTQVPSDVEIRKILADRIGAENLGIGIVVGVIDSNGRRVVGYGSLGKNDRRHLDGDTVCLMLRALLNDRFKLATHSEERLVNAYNLVAVKPKLKKADPTSRTRFREGPAADGKDLRDKNPMLSRLVTCQNMSMTQFAEKLQSIAPGYIHTPVLDATGLDGSWDFTLSFSPAGMDQFITSQGAGGRGGGEAASQPSGGPAEASDPSGAITLFEAIEKQLGLKLEKQKRPTSVLVIDHVEQKPTDN